MDILKWDVPQMELLWPKCDQLYTTGLPTTYELGCESSVVTEQKPGGLGRTKPYSHAQSTEQDVNSGKFFLLWQDWEIKASGLLLLFKNAKKQSSFFSVNLNGYVEFEVIPMSFIIRCSCLQELGQKNDRIAQLEREKGSLIRDMFDARANQRPNTYHDDTTFL